MMINVQTFLFATQIKRQWQVQLRFKKNQNDQCTDHILLIKHWNKTKDLFNLCKLWKITNRVEENNVYFFK